VQRHDPVNAKGPERWPASHRAEGTHAIHSRPPGLDGSLAPGRAPRGSRWFEGLWIGCLLIVGCAGTAFATAAVWQLGTVVDGMVEIARSSTVTPMPVTLTPVTSTSPPPRGVRSDPTPPAPRSSTAEGRSRATPASPVSLDNAPLHASLATSQTFDAAAEASEKAIPLGVAPESSYERTECGDVFVYIVSIAEAAPMASAASLAIGKGSPARFRRPGQRIGDWEVLAITDDWSGANPGVWLLKDNAICRAELAGNPTRVHVPLKQVKKPPVKPRRRRARR
jgi:hypothetical protein